MRVDELLELCGLTKLAGLRPHQISGGQRQRAELSRILDRFDMPMVMVSHDLDDVDHFAQTLVAFGQGRVLDVIDFETRRKTESANAILDPLFLAAEIQEPQ